MPEPDIILGRASLRLWRLLGGELGLKPLCHCFVGLRNLHEAGARLGVVHFAGMRTTFLCPVTVLPGFIPVGLVARAHLDISLCPETAYAGR